MKKLSQKGFTLVEGLLIMVVFALIVGVGYYIHNSQQDKKKDTSTSQATKQVTKATPKETTATETQQAVVKIHELGIQLTNLPAELTGLTYTSEVSTASSITASIMLTTDRLDSCSFGHLNRYSGNHDASMDAEGGYIFIKQDSGSWLGYVHNGTPCLQSEAARLLQEKLDIAFQQYSKTPANFKSVQ
jgi:type II secretory pathway pseudopilin PulG